MDTIALASVMAAAAAFSTLVYSAYRDTKRSKRDLTVRIHEKWTSDGMRRVRTIAWNTFEQIWNPSGKEKVPLGKLHATETSKDALGSIEHFFDDLGRLAKENLLDKKFSEAVFHDISDTWFTIFENIDWENEAEDWYEKKLRPHREELYKFWGKTFESRQYEVARTVKKNDKRLTNGAPLG